ncbi:SGNH/GDSL hydrolase family protein [Mucilaginibacter gilvus]|uniref:SGNH/GDSL hydrolase family protein n=1 Tax=Mucilaginibacter gilvus TaxID=2305909 RepID=A0A3S3VAJ4_9SPHI|nr:SGNH/GDSL hydrolase family protein [Mucilaginibacter gilvus]RWY49177.1 SGNH/GDSL hydrolase family protein [Mucilaginibacter gilvus]
MKRILTTILITYGLLGCNKQMQLPVTPTSNPVKPAPAYADNLTYLALGDSYTIGEAVDAPKSFPYQLAAQLKLAGHLTGNPDIIARTGWTTGELINAINASGTASKKYSIVTLLIGVNNQYRGNSKDVYRTEFIQLLNTAITYADGNKNHVFVVSIPDWGSTPYANGYDRNKIAADIDAFNTIAKTETDKQGVAYVDITTISKKAATDASLNASDGLHPSAAMYNLWVNAIAPVVLSHL